MVRQLVRSVLVTTGAVLAAAPVAHGCVIGAGPSPSADQRVQGADVAFTGTVAASGPRAAPSGVFAGTTMTVAVDRVLKGTVPATVELVTGLTSCAAPTRPVGARVGATLTPATPTPWQFSIFEDIVPEQLDTLPVDAAFAPLAVRALAARPSRRAIQVHVKARACTTLRASLTQPEGAVVIAMTAADGPRCTRGARGDRCVTLNAGRRLGSRALRPAGARRVATATRCPALAS